MTKNEIVILAKNLNQTNSNNSEFSGVFNGLPTFVSDIASELIGNSDNGFSFGNLGKLGSYIQMGKSAFNIIKRFF